MAARSLETHGDFVFPLLQPGLDVLDAGCGAGTMTQELAENVMPGRVTGVDLKRTHIDLANRLAQGREIMNIKFAAENACDLPFADDSFDLVFSHALFEQLPHPLDALREFQRVLRPFGRVALCSQDGDAFQIHPHSEVATRALKTYRDLRASNGEHPNAGAYLSRWLRDANFSILEEGMRLETHSSSAGIAEHIAMYLDQAGEKESAQDLCNWAEQPDAIFIQCWRYTLGLNAR